MSITLDGATRDPSGGGTAETAAQTPFTPEGDISSEWVQSAIAELDTEKVAKAGDTMTGPLNLQVATVSASATQTQGGGTPIAADITRITVCATAGDACTLRAAVAGAVAVVKNEGAEAGQIFPASGEDLGAGANTAVAIAVGQTRAWRCIVAGTWQPVDVAWMPVLLTNLTEGDVLQLVAGVLVNRSLSAALGVYGQRVATLAVTAPDGTVATGDDKAILRIPAALNGWILSGVAAALLTASSSGAVSIQISNGGTDMLSTALTIDQDETDTSTAATPAVIDTGADDVSTGDLLSVDVDSAGTGAAGLVVELTFTEA